MIEPDPTSTLGASALIWHHVFSLVPHLIWAAVVIFVLLWIGRANVLASFQRMTKVSIAGLELQFREELKETANVRGLSIPTDELERAAHRLAFARELLRGARILWVDDRPEGIQGECRLIENAGARVRRVTSSDAALEELDKHRYDLVISDIQRGDQADAGIKFGETLAKRTCPPPLIFYVGSLQKPVPVTAFGITNLPSELLHLVVDSLSRTRS